MFNKELSSYSRLIGLILGINSQLRQHTMSNGAADYIMFCSYPEVSWSIYKDCDDNFRVGFVGDDNKVHDAYNEINRFVEK